MHSNQVKHRVESQLNSQNTKERLGVTFHRTFSLVRSGILQVLDLAAVSANTKARCISRETIRELSTLGTIYVEAMPRYAFGTGLLDSQNCLTHFGIYARKYDGLLEQLSTQWLMHYFLSAPHGPGPAFWHELVVTRFRVGDEFTTDEIAAQISEFVAREDGKRLALRSARSTVTVFLGTYTKEEGLGRLGILRSVGSQRYRVQEPDAPPAWAFAYALLDYWRAQFGDLLTINLDALYGERSLTSLFLCGAGRLNMMLRTIQSEGYVDIYRVAPPYQVVLLRQDSEPLLQKLYEHHESE